MALLLCIRLMGCFRCLLSARETPYRDGRYEDVRPLRRSSGSPHHGAGWTLLHIARAHVLTDYCWIALG